MQHIYKIKGSYFQETFQHVKNLIDEIGYTEDEPMKKTEELNGNTSVISGCYHKWYLLSRENDYMYPVLICSPEETVVIISGTNTSEFHEKFQTFVTRMAARYDIKANFRG